MPEYLLQEDGFYLLQEDNFKLILDDDYSSRTAGLITLERTEQHTTLDASQLTEAVGIGFGEFANTRYRAQGFQVTRNGFVTHIGFKLASTGSMGMKVILDVADSNSFPTGTLGTGLYSFQITNGNLSTAFKIYALPVPFPVKTSQQYTFYLAPWNTGTDAYQDDYRDLRSVTSNPYASGKQAQYAAGTWTNNDSSNADAMFEIYVKPAANTAGQVDLWHERRSQTAGQINIRTRTNKTALVSPVAGANVTDPVTFVWTIPDNVDNRPVFAQIQVDNNSDFSSTIHNLNNLTLANGFEYWNGSAWVAYPIGGVTSAFYGNQARISLTIGSTGLFYWRVRGGAT